MSLEEKVNGEGAKRSGLLKALGGLGLLLHSGLHLLPLAGVGYLTLGGESISHPHDPDAGIGHYLLDFLGTGFAIWGIYYAYNGIREYFAHRNHGHNGYKAEYAH